jgi:hypothetical protein
VIPRIGALREVIYFTNISFIALRCMEEVLLKNSDAVILLIADEFGILYY